MILITHIVVAITSILCTAYAFIFPSVRVLRVSYSLIGLTLASGTYLVLSTGSRLVQACITGLVYISIISVAIIAARSKLARQEI